MQTSSSLSVIASLTLVFFAISASAQPIPVPNPSFELGTDSPTGWKLTGQGGTWLSSAAAAGQRAITASGDGTTSSAWQSDALPLKPSSLYILSFQAKSLGSSKGTATSGATFANRDLGALGSSWEGVHTPIFTPQTLSPNDSRLRFGQWEVSGAVAFDDIQLLPAQAIHARSGDLELGDGENLDGNTYTFAAPLRGPEGNFSRPLAGWRGHFNTNRWDLNRDSLVIYEHRLPGRHLSQMQVRVGVCYYVRGELVIEVSTDQAKWQEIGRIGKVASGTFPVPAEIQPAQQVFVRLRTGDAALQVADYDFTAQVDGPPVKLIGQTRIVGIRAADPRFTVTLRDIGQALPGGQNVVIAAIDNPGPALTVDLPSRPNTPVPAGQSTLQWPYDVPGVGQHNLTFAIGGFLAEAAVRVPELYDTSFGQSLPPSTADLGVWWASSGWKISRTRPVPQATSAAMLIRLAKNEAEAAQLVLRPAKAVRNLTLKPADLTGPAGTKLPATSIDILRERYLHVTRPTDATAAVGDWPDPLPQSPRRWNWMPASTSPSGSVSTFPWTPPPATTREPLPCAATVCPLMSPSA